MPSERDVPWVAFEQAAVIDGGDPTSDRSHPRRAELLAPDIEKITEGVGPLDRRFDVDDPVGGMRVQPVEAAPSAHEGTGRRLRHHRVVDADALRDAARLAVDEHGQVRMDVKRHLFAG